MNRNINLFMEKFVTSSMTKTLGYIRLLTDEFQRMVDFYTETMELPCTHLNDNAQYAELSGDGVTLAIFSRQHMATALKMEVPPAIHECQDKSIIVFRVASVDDEAEKLTKKGVALLSLPTDMKDWGTRTLHLRDPDGNIIEMITSLQ